MRESMRTMLSILAIVVLAANAWATFVVARSTTATSVQKALQLLLAWLIPLLGAVVVVVFHRLDRRSLGPEPEGARLDGSEVDVAMAVRHDGHQ